jgi:hypothetical protein
LLPSDPFVTDGTTFVKPIGVGFTLLMGRLPIVLSRRYVLVPIIVLMYYMTWGIKVRVEGLNLMRLVSYYFSVGSGWFFAANAADHGR